MSAVETEVSPQLPKDQSKFTTVEIAALIGRNVDTVNYHIKHLLLLSRLQRIGRVGLWDRDEATLIINHCKANSRKSYSERTE